jgi:nucleotide-binding universal stress UspA family protein
MSIVFGTTLEPESEPFAEVAARLALAWSVPLRLVHVSEDPRAPIVLGTDEEHLLGDVRASLGRQAAHLEALTGASVQTHLAGGAVVDGLVSVARFELADLLVLGSRDDRAHGLLGATAERVCRKSSVPVLTLRDPDRLDGWLRGERSLRVLVGADLGAAAQAARAFAVRLARTGSAQVDVVSIARPAELAARLGLPSAPSAHELSHEARDALLRDLRHQAPEGEVATLRAVASRGSADVRLVTFADEGDYDLVLVGQRRQSLVEQLWYGSVGRGVLRASPVSVACVPPSSAQRVPSFRAPEVVLVGVDLGDSGMRALAQALALVGEGGSVHLAHVVEAMPTHEDAFRAREQAWHALARVGVDEGRDAAASLERHLLEGEPARELTALAERLGADVLVVGARRRSVLSRVLLGSTARSLAEDGRVPVLVVPVPEA